MTMTMMTFMMMSSHAHPPWTRRPLRSLRWQRCHLMPVLHEHDIRYVLDDDNHDDDDFEQTRISWITTVQSGSGSWTRTWPRTCTWPHIHPAMHPHPHLAMHPYQAMQPHPATAISFTLKTPSNINSINMTAIPKMIMVSAPTDHSNFRSTCRSHVDTQIGPYPDLMPHHVKWLQTVSNHVKPCPRTCHRASRSTSQSTSQSTSHRTSQSTSQGTSQSTSQSTSHRRSHRTSQKAHHFGDNCGCKEQQHPACITFLTRYKGARQIPGSSRRPRLSNGTATMVSHQQRPTTDWWECIAGPRHLRARYPIKTLNADTRGSPVAATRPTILTSAGWSLFPLFPFSPPSNIFSWSKVFLAHNALHVEK